VKRLFYGGGSSINETWCSSMKYEYFIHFSHC